MAQPNVTSEVAPGEQLATERAFERLRAEIEGVPDDELISISIDVMAAITTLIGALPELRALRPELDRHLRTFDFERFDRLEDYALALSHANTRYRSASAPKGDIVKMADELTAIRDRFLANALSLAAHGLLDPTRLEECKTANGYRPLVGDVFILVNVFKDNWNALEGKTPITLTALQSAGHLALELLAAVGEREQAPVLVGEATLTRLRAFTLFSRVYEDVRRAVQYVRGKAGDADAIMPSLYAGRGPKRRTGDNVGKPSTEDDVPSNPSTAQVDDPPPIRIDNPHGFPLTPPFTS